MQHLRILIVEDELIVATDMQDMLQEVGYTVCGIARNYDEALSLIKEEKPDLCLLDISIGGIKSGIDVGLFLKVMDVPFLFTTSHTGSAIIENAKSTKPYGYLIKPFNKLDLYASIEMAMSHFERREEIGLFLPMGRSKHHVSLKELQLIKANGNYVELKIGEKRVALRKNLKEFESKLPQGHPFIRVHKSYLINRSHIQSFNQLNIQLIDGTKIPIGRTYYQEIKSQLFIV